MRGWLLAGAVVILVAMTGCGRLMNREASISPEQQRQQELQRELKLVEVYYNLAQKNRTEQDTLDAEFCYQFALDLLDSLSLEYDSDSAYQAMQITVNVAYDTYLDEVHALSADTMLTNQVLADLESIYADSSALSNLADSVKVPDMPLVLNRKVESAIRYFSETTKGRRVFATWMRRAGRYEKLLRSHLKDVGAPQDLFYLAMIESGLRPNANSYARAVGMWQFISATGRAYNLNHSWWYDDRRDPVKATRAAGQHLLDLYERFGDWYLAIAGYNFNPAKISRRMRTYNVSEFWDLPRLPRQTRNYVPTYIAAVTIAHDLEKYNFIDILPDEPLVFDTMTVRECVDLNVVAESIGTTFAELQELNPALLRWCTPPDVNSWVLNLPVGTRELFAAKYADIPKQQKMKWLHHRVSSGETLSTIARRYDVAMSEIQRFNKIKGTMIRKGQDLVIPIPQNKTYYSKYVASNTTSKSSAKSARRAASQQKQKIISNVPGRNRQSYVVRSGDSLWEIARQFDVSVTEIRQWNGLGGSRVIQPGQSLTLWLPPAGAASAVTEQLAVAEAPDQSSPVQEGGKAAIHVVRSGDTLWDIARANNVTIDQIKSWNGMRTNKIKPGQELKIYR